MSLVFPDTETKGKKERLRLANSAVNNYNATTVDMFRSLLDQVKLYTSLYTSVAS